MSPSNNSFTIKDWIKEQKKETSDLWIWRHITKHFAYGKDLPTQLGDYLKLKNLHSLMIEFIKNEVIKNNHIPKEYKEIETKFKKKENFDKFVTDIIKSWENIYKEFIKFYFKKIEDKEGEGIITNDFIIEFIQDKKDITDKFSKLFEVSSKENKNYYTAFKKLFRHLEEEIWITNTYHSTPLFSSFTFYEPWRWFYLFWLYYQLVLNEIENDDDWSSYFFEELNGEELKRTDQNYNSHEKKLSLIPLCQTGCLVRNEIIHGISYFFIFGPVFSPQEKIFFNDKDIYTKKIKSTILLFRIFQKLLNRPTVDTFSKSLTEADIFLKACGTKPYIFNNTFREKIDLIKNLFDILIRTIIINHKQILEQSERHIWVLVSLLRWSIYNGPQNLNHLLSYI